MLLRASRSVLLAAIVAIAPSRLAAAAPLAIHIHSEQAMFQVLIAPGTAGTDSIVLQLMSGEGTLLSVKEATLFLSLPGRGIEPLAHKANRGADGYWHLDGIAIPEPGRWHLRIVAVTDFREITLEDDVDVPAR